MTISTTVAVEQNALLNAARRKPHMAVGVLLYITYFILLTFNPQLPLLTELHANELFKQLSGFVLLFFVLGQWWLGYLRMTGRQLEAAKHIPMHKWLGVFAPLILLIHTVEFGYAFQSVLLIVFVGTSLVGLVSFHDVRVRKPWFAKAWTVAHVSMAVALPVLILYHVYITYTYS